MLQFTETDVFLSSTHTTSIQMQNIETTTVILTNSTNIGCLDDTQPGNSWNLCLAAFTNIKQTDGKQYMYKQAKYFKNPTRKSFHGGCQTGFGIVGAFFGTSIF